MNWKPAIEQGNFGNAKPWGNEFNFRTEGAVAVRKVKSRLKRDQWELVNDDRIVFLGGTFVERLQTCVMRGVSPFEREICQMQNHVGQQPQPARQHP